MDKRVDGDYLMTIMRAGVAELKANLSAYLRRVREGEVVTVMDRDRPIARIVAAEEKGYQVRPARKTLSDVSPPRALRTQTDIVQLLLEERGER
jgi:prevent-host-death family protein